MNGAALYVRQRLDHRMGAAFTITSLGIGAESIGRRALIFIAVVTFHIFLIVLLVLTRQTAPPIPNRGTLSAFTLSAAPNPPSIPIAASAVVLDAELVPANPAETFSEQQQAIQGDPDGEACSPLDAVTVQLANDPLVPLAISRVPQTDRSISEAIVMWNAEWSAASADQKAPLAMVREHVLLTLETLPPDCLAIPVMGPRLIAIPQDGRTTFLAFGSGEWSWQQLMKPAEETAATQENDWTWEELFADTGSPRTF